jgi:DNA polymerase-4
MVLHVRLEAFFASLIQQDHPHLRGRPVLVAGRDVVGSCSREARTRGVRDGMPLARALARCPDAVLVAPEPARWQEAHAQLRAIWARHAARFEAPRPDEARLYLPAGPGVAPDEVARSIQADVLAKTGLRSVVGVAASAGLARVAASRARPGGRCVVAPADEAAWLAALPIAALPGIGPRTVELLAREGLGRVADLRAVPEARLAGLVGPYARQLAWLRTGRE